MRGDRGEMQEEKEPNTRMKHRAIIIRQVPVWVEAILHEWGTIFPENKDCSFWSCCRRDLFAVSRLSTFLHRSLFSDV